MVYHILKDGSKVSDITGHVVKLEDAEALYRFIHSINLKRSVKPTYSEKNNKRKVML